MAYMGTCKAEAGGTISVGDTLGINSSGDVIEDAEVTGGGSKDLRHIAIALQGGVNLEVIWILLKPSHLLGLT